MNTLQRINDQIERAKEMPAANVAAALCEAIRELAEEADNSFVNGFDLVSIVTAKLDQWKP